MANLNQFIFNLYSIFENHPGFQNIGINLDDSPKNTIHISHLIKFKYISFPEDFELNLGSSLRKLDTIFLRRNSVVTFEASYDKKDCEMIIQIFSENQLHKIYRYDIKSLRVIRFGFFKGYHEIEIRK